MRGALLFCSTGFSLMPSFFCRYKAGLKEIQILNKLREHDLDDKKHIVKLERTFEHRGHLCMVFESLSFVPFASLS